MSERKVKAEKGTIMSIAIMAITTGITLISKDEIVTGLILVGVGIILILLREHLKFHRWKSLVGSNSYWRGKPR